MQKLFLKNDATSHRKQRWNVGIWTGVETVDCGSWWSSHRVILHRQRERCHHEGTRWRPGTCSQVEHELHWHGRHQLQTCTIALSTSTSSFPTASPSVENSSHASSLNQFKNPHLASLISYLTHGIRQLQLDWDSQTNFFVPPPSRVKIYIRHLFPTLCLITKLHKHTTVYFSILFIFTALHEIQTRSSDENSVRLSVTRVIPDKMDERSVQIFIPYERTIILVFWEEKWLVGGDPFYVKFWVNRPPLEWNRRFSTNNRS